MLNHPHQPTNLELLRYDFVQMLKGTIAIGIIIIPVYTRLNSPDGLVFAMLFGIVIAFVWPYWLVDKHHERVFRGHHKGMPYLAEARLVITPFLPWMVLFTVTGPFSLAMKIIIFIFMFFAACTLLYSARRSAEIKAKHPYHDNP